MEIYEIENGCKVFSWCPDADKEVASNPQHLTGYEQMEIVAKLPYVRHAALMPDCHSGYSLPIGGVVLCENVVVPNFVGKDIGCGVASVRMSIHKADIEDEDLRKKILHSLSRGIPVSFAHNTQIRENELKNLYQSQIEDIVDRNIGKVSEKHNPVGNFRKEFASQLGTLGGG